MTAVDGRLFASAMVVAGITLGCGDPLGGSQVDVVHLECREVPSAGLRVGDVIDMETSVAGFNDVGWGLCDGVELSSASTSFALTTGTDDAMVEYLNERVCPGCVEVDLVRMCNLSIGGRFVVGRLTATGVELDVPVKSSHMFHARIGGTLGTYRGPDGRTYERDECE